MKKETRCYVFKKFIIFNLFNKYLIFFALNHPEWDFGGRSRIVELMVANTGFRVSMPVTNSLDTRIGRNIWKTRKIEMMKLSRNEYKILTAFGLRIHSILPRTKIRFGTCDPAKKAPSKSGPFFSGKPKIIQPRVTQSSSSRRVFRIWTSKSFGNGSSEP